MKLVTASPDSAEATYAQHLVDLAIVLPTYNERGNIAELVFRLESCLKNIAWELIFVDDDSPDDTAAVIAELARRNPRIRLIHRVGRRGLSSACIEGMLSTTAQFVAVMDADMQHDETILPQMLVTLREDSLDIVVGTRNSEGGSMGEFGRRRVLLSRLGQKISNAVCRCNVTDPMSGFFLCRRSFFLEVVRHLNGGGFKILVDMLASAERTVRVGEIGYTFRARTHGESKLDVSTAAEYLFLVLDKLVDKFTGRALPLRFAAFGLVGAAGFSTHLLCLALLMLTFHWHFIAAQIAATYVAMTENFFLNNLFTWRDRKLRGMRLVSGMASFWLACSFGAWANVIFARALFQSGVPWYLAGIAGIILSSIWNYSIANLFTWQKPQTVCDPAGIESSVYEADISL